MSDLLSPIRYRNSELISVHFDISDSDIKREQLLQCENALSVSRNAEIRTTENGSLEADCLLRVSIEVSYPGNPEEDEPGRDIMSFSCEMSASSTSPQMYEDPDISEKVVLANTISYIWGKIRVLFETLCASTSSRAAFRDISLPALNPYALFGDDGVENGGESEV